MQTIFMTDLLPDKTTIAKLVVTGTLVLTLIGCGKNSEAEQGSEMPPPPEVSVAEVVVRDIMPWEEFTGRIEAKEVVQIRPRVGGVIESVQYTEGNIVKKGDLLFIIDQQPFKAELNRAEADLTRARAQATLANTEIQRAKNLVKRKLLSQDEYDQRLAAHDSARATVRSAEATVQLARLNMSYTEIRSPINGRTGRALVTQGNLVSSSTAPTPDLLTTVLSVDPVYVVFDSDELTYLKYFANPIDSTASADNKNRKVYVGLGNEDGFPREGYVDFINNRVASDTGTISMRAIIDNKDHKLTPGLFARIKLLDSTPVQAMLINEQSIMTDQDRKYVYILGEKNQAMRRDISIGRTIDKLRIVTDGLKPGDQLIVYGIQKVFFPGMPVKPQTIGMTDPPSAPAPAAAAH